MRVLAVALSALAIAVAGCGGQSKEERYRHQLEPLNQSLVQLGRTVGKGLQTARGKSDSQLGREFGGYADRLGKLRRQIAGLDAPGKLAREQAALVRAMGTVERALHGIEGAAAKHNFKGAERAARQLVISSVDLRNARMRLTRDAAKSG